MNSIIDKVAMAVGYLVFYFAATRRGQGRGGAVTAPRPVRIQLSRRKGFSLQALSLATNGLPAVNVARPSMFGNRWKIGV